MVVGQYNVLRVVRRSVSQPECSLAVKGILHKTRNRIQDTVNNEKPRIAHFVFGSQPFLRAIRSANRNSIPRYSPPRLYL